MREHSDEELQLLVEQYQQLQANFRQLALQAERRNRSSFLAGLVAGVWACGLVGWAIFLMVK